MEFMFMGMYLACGIYPQEFKFYLCRISSKLSIKFFMSKFHPDLKHWMIGRISDPIPHCVVSHRVLLVLSLPIKLFRNKIISNLNVSLHQNQRSLGRYLTCFSIQHRYLRYTTCFNDTLDKFTKHEFFCPSKVTYSL